MVGFRARGRRRHGPGIGDLDILGAKAESEPR